jgi:P27 family predicted phage terminase small subunit
MGKRGPKPTPTQTLKLRGSWLVNNRKGEPQPEKSRPNYPDWISDNAKEAWEQLIPQLEQMGVLTHIDGMSLTVLCQTWSVWRKAVEFINKHGEVYPIKDGEGNVKCFMPFPQVALMHTTAITLDKYFSAFGLDPASRSRITINGKKEENDKGKDRFFAG